MNAEAPEQGLSRRQFLCLSSAAALALAGGQGCGADASDPEPEPTPRPIQPARNLVLVISDDQRADVLGHLGHPVARTPSLDRLASEGVSLTRLFSVAMDCQPARVSLFTSLYAKVHGVTDNRSRVPDSLLFLSEVLRDAGLATGGFGKLHDGTNAGQGLIEMKPFIGAQSPYYSRFIRWDNKAIESGRTSLDPKDCPTHTILQQGIEFIRRNASRRFFALISIPEPHPPYIAPEPYYSRIEPDVVPATSFRDSTRFWQGKNPGWVEHYRAIWEKISRSELQRALATYCAKIEFLDAEFGRLRQTLEQEGILDETLLVYLSDHGDMAGLGGVLGKSGLMYDPVLRQPLVLRYPPLGAAGLKVDALLESVDVAPTLLDLLGVQVPSSFQGKVSTQVLRGGRPLREDVVTLMAAALARMARTRRHKLIVYADGFQELYDLEQDPLEMDNRRSTADPALVRDLEARLQRAG